MSIHVPKRESDGSLPDVPSYGEFPFSLLQDFGCETQDGTMSFLYDCRGVDRSDENTVELSTCYKLHLHTVVHGIKIACALGNLRCVKDIVGVWKAAYKNGPNTAEDADAVPPDDDARAVRKFLATVAEYGLQLAARNGHDDVVEYLLSPAVRNVLDFDIQANHNGAFHEACEHKRASTARLLLEKGAAGDMQTGSAAMKRVLGLVDSGSRPAEQAQQEAQ